ncbi:3-hydroxyacyl-ACP dehydratase FabZ family protein [Nocardia gipuzkoensis]|uniref:3-hydroxyacyl-ACP dehydratase FabZ family protein n=1 Tax=Nocardia gipuzkoensis TaxID=2749991 RepID=UPI003EE1430F
MTASGAAAHTDAPPIATATLSVPAFDRILLLEPGVRAVAQLNVTGTLPLFATHFPRYPVLPGVLLIESAVALIRLAAGEPELRVRRAEGIRFRRFVVPGDQVEFTVSAQHDAAEPAVWQLAARVDGAVAASISALTFAEVPA